MLAQADVLTLHRIHALCQLTLYEVSQTLRKSSRKHGQHLKDWQAKAKQKSLTQTDQPATDNKSPV